MVVFAGLAELALAVAVEVLWCFFGVAAEEVEVEAVEDGESAAEEAEDEAAP